jgi:hypothetical protein
MFAHAGFFHLATGHAFPICSLLAALDQEPDPSEALIVLPEAFNLGRPYYESGPPDINRDYVIDDLFRICRTRGVKFVVGLIEPRPETGERPLSSAYFVDEAGGRLICHKELWDGVGHYTGCPIEPDRDNPIVLDDACILTVICRDIENSARCRRIDKDARCAARPQNFVCIPAAMSRSDWFGPRRESPLYVPEFTARVHLIVANSDPRGVGSFITDIDRHPRECVEADDKVRNQIRLIPLA